MKIVYAALILFLLVSMSGCITTGLAVRGLAAAGARAGAVAGARAGAMASIVTGAAASRIAISRFAVASSIRAAAVAGRASRVSVIGRLPTGNEYRAIVTRSRLQVFSQEFGRQSYATRIFGRRTDILDSSGERVGSSYEAISGKKLHHYYYTERGRPIYSGSDVFISESEIAHYDAMGAQIGRSSLRLRPDKEGGAGAIIAMLSSVVFEKPIPPKETLSRCDFERPRPRFGEVREVNLGGFDLRSRTRIEIQFLQEGVFIAYTRSLLHVVEDGETIKTIEFEEPQYIHEVKPTFFSVVGKEGMTFIRYSDWKSISLKISRHLKVTYSENEGALFIADGGMIHKIDFETGSFVRSAKIELVVSNDSERLQIPTIGLGDYKVSYLTTTADGGGIVLLLRAWASPSILSVWDAGDLVELDRVALVDDFLDATFVKSQFACEGRFLILVSENAFAQYAILDLMTNDIEEGLTPVGEISFRDDLRYLFYYLSLTRKLAVYDRNELPQGVRFGSRGYEEMSIRGSNMALSPKGDLLVIAGFNGKLQLVKIH